MDKHPGGRPQEYFPDDVFAKFKEYIEDCVDRGRFANIAGFRVYSDISQSTYYQIMSKPEFLETKKKIDDILEDCAINGKLSAPEKIFYLKNKFGWADKQEIVSTSDVTQRISLDGLTTDDLKDILKPD